VQNVRRVPESLRLVAADAEGARAMSTTRKTRDFRADAALRPQPKRQGPDFWSTPECLLNALITEILPTLPAGIIWEPACGDGRLAEALRQFGRHVVATDLYTDGVDFLSDAPRCQGTSVRSVQIRLSISWIFSLPGGCTWWTAGPPGRLYYWFAMMR
jgi:hypothetical protein